MNEELDMDLEIIELGDAKEETKGFRMKSDPEQDSTFPYRQIL